MQHREFDTQPLSAPTQVWRPSADAPTQPLSPVPRERATHPAEQAPRQSVVSRIGSVARRAFHELTDMSTSRKLWRNVGVFALAGVAADVAGGAVVYALEAGSPAAPTAIVRPVGGHNHHATGLVATSPSPEQSQSPAPVKTVTVAPTIISTTIIERPTTYITIEPTSAPTSTKVANAPGTLPTHSPTLSPSPEQSTPPPTNAPAPGGAPNGPSGTPTP